MDSPLEKPTKRRFVLDTFALLVYFDKEEGVAIVKDLLSVADAETQLYLSIINLGEFIYASEREHGLDQANSRLEDTRRLPITLAGVNERRVLAAAHIKANHAVSYADAFAIALGQELGTTIVTGDPEFTRVAKIVDILWLRDEKTKEGKKARERSAVYRQAKRK